MTSQSYSRYRGYDEITPQVFNLIFAATASYGMLVYGVFAALFATVALGAWGFLGVFLVSLLGTHIAASNENVVAKIAGVSVCAGGLGVISASFIHQYKIGSVVEIAGATIGFVLLLGAIGTLFPKMTESWGGMLFSALIALIIAQILLPIVYVAMGLPLSGVIEGLNWVGVILFAGITVYDFGQAQMNAKTVENAMNAGFSVFLDAANLFIRLLSLFGGKSDD